MLPFWKMNGLGNEILVVDARGTDARVSAEAAIRLAAGETAFDQIMEVSDHDVRDAAIRILNCDGSEAGACGNGMRCVALWLSSETGGNDFRFAGPEGRLDARVDGDAVTVSMGRPRFGWEAIPLAEEFHDTTGFELQIGPIDAPVLHTPSGVSMGNPHAVFWVDRDVWSYDLDRFGPLLENHPIFPERANITIADVRAPDHAIIRTWERGAGLTRACGSAACATVVCAARMGAMERAGTITVPGGDLAIEWRDDDQVMMTGPAAFEFHGRLDPVTGAWERAEAAA